jgi:hypothetical protein
MSAQQQYTVTLRQLTDNIRRQKPNVDPNNCVDWINQGIRSVLDRKPYWSGTLKRGVLKIPNSYTSGSIQLFQDSTAVTGTGTNWTVSDKVNTIVPNGIRKTGLQTIVPASMAGIDADTVLYVDGSGTPEIVPVVQTTRTAFLANFQYQHNPNCTLTTSSLAGRQLRLGKNYPTYSIRAITSATSAEIDNPWAGPDFDGTYVLCQMYYTLSPDIKEIFIMADLFQMIPIRLHIQQEALNRIDPQRAASGPPYMLADHTPNENGNMQYEVYPIQLVARQLPYLYAAQWPELKADGDRPPSFINPNVFLYSALSKAFRTPSEKDDAFVNPKTADYYEVMAEKELQGAMQSDESKAQRAYTNMADIFGGGADFRQTHDFSVTDDYAQWW